MSADAHNDCIGMFQRVEEAIDSLGKVLNETYLCETANHIERQAFLDAILSKLSRSLEENISEVKLRRNASTPINRLPTEILSHIFEIWPVRIAPSQYKYLVSLSRVCQRWRSIIVDNGAFWTTLDFMGNVELVKAILQRSKEAKLRIEITDLLFIRPEKIALVKSILRSQAHRIEKITATLRASNVDIIGDALFQSFPSLRYLTLRGDYYKQIQQLPHIPFTASTNNLEVLDLFYNARIPWAILQAILHNVKKLKIYFEDLDSYLNFFSHIHSFNNLRVLSVHCYFIGNLPQLPPITVHGLTSLLIQNSSLISLVDFLHTPNLRRLTICDEINHTFHSDLDFDYTSIRYLSIGAFPTSGFFTFYVVGSTEQDDTPSDYLWNQEFHISSSSPTRRFQIKMHFNQADTGFLNALKVLDNVLSKTTAVCEVRIPCSLPSLRGSSTENRVLLSMIMEHAPKINLFSLVSPTPCAYLFER